MQDALVRCFSRGSALRDVGAAEAYVRRTVLTIFLDGYRRRVRRDGLRHLVARPDETSGPEQSAPDRLDVHAALATLRPRLRACVVLRFYDDLTVPEIARRLDLSDGTVKRYLFDAVDPGRPDAELAVEALAGRIRRRRAVRAGGRAAVGVGAAGAVAIGGVQLAERASTSPAGDTTADLCGAAVGSLARDPDGTWLALGSGVDVHRVLQQHLPEAEQRPETHLGVADPHWLPFAIVRRDDDGDGPREGTQVLLARDGHVVAWGQDTTPGEERWRLETVPDRAVSGTWESGTVLVEPQTCDGSATLAAGTYDVDVAQAPGTGFSGPWTTEIVAPPAGVALPVDFPTDAPLPDDTVLDATQRPGPAARPERTCLRRAGGPATCGSARAPGDRYARATARRGDDERRHP